MQHSSKTCFHLTIGSLFIALSLAIAPARAQTLFVANQGGNTLREFSPGGADLGDFATTGLLGPTALAFDASSNLFVSNIAGNTIRKFSPSGTDLGDFATTGLNQPRGLAFDKSGNLYVANNDNRIRKFSPTGVDLGDFATTGLNIPRGLAFDKSGNLYAGNLGDNTIRKFSPTGVDLGYFTTTGVAGVALIAFDKSDNLYVTNMAVDAIRKFSPTGVDLGDFATTGLNQPAGLALDTSGNLYVSNRADNTIRKFSPTGVDLGYFATTGMVNPVGLGFRPVPEPQLAWHGPSLITTNTFQGIGVTGNPSLVQAIPGTYGTKGNYELVVPLFPAGIGHFFRDNDNPNLPWSGPFTFATDQGAVDAVSLIQSNFSTAGNGPGNLAVVARVGTRLLYFYRDDVAPFAWHGPTTITTGVSGVPSFVQARPGTFGTRGSFELVTPLLSGGMGHFFRDNDDPNLPWTQTDTFGTELGFVDAVSLVQSNFSSQFRDSEVQGPGNLAVVARVGNDLLYFYRDDVAPFAWHGPTMIIAMGVVTGTPSFVQATPGTYGTMGNYELATPLRSGGIAHFFRDNDDPTLPWSQTATFGTKLGIVTAVSLIQSNLSTEFVQTGVQGRGNLAVVSVTGFQLDYFFRDDD